MESPSAFNRNNSSSPYADRARPSTMDNNKRLIGVRGIYIRQGRPQTHNFVGKKRQSTKLKTVSPSPDRQSIAGSSSNKKQSLNAINDDLVYSKGAANSKPKTSNRFVNGGQKSQIKLTTKKGFSKVTLK